MNRLNPPMEHKVSQILKWLLTGGSVEIDGVFWCMGECDDGSLDFAQKAITESGEDVFLRTHVTLGAFINMMDNKVSEQEYVRICSSIALADTPKRKKRVLRMSPGLLQ